MCRMWCMTLRHASMPPSKVPILLQFCCTQFGPWSPANSSSAAALTAWRTGVCWNEVSGKSELYSALYLMIWYFRYLVSVSISIKQFVNKSCDDFICNFSHLHLNTVGVQFVASVADHKLWRHPHKSVGRMEKKVRGARTSLASKQGEY